MKRVSLTFFVVLMLLTTLVGLAPQSVSVASAQSPVPSPTPEPPLIIGMEYISPVAIPWSAAHLAGYGWALMDIFGPSYLVVPDGDGFKVVDRGGKEVVRTVFWTATKPDDFSPTTSDRVAEDLIRQGAKLIFNTAENWCQSLYENVAPKHPDVNFMCIRGPVGPNFGSMYPRSWEGFYVACAAAASIVDEPNLGMLGAYETNPQVASNHGACARGFADSWAENHTSTPKISTVYIDNWANMPDETVGAESLAAAGARVVAVHQDSTAAASALAGADPRVWVVGYDSNWANFTKPNGHILTSVTLDWTDAYSRAIRMTLDKNFVGFKWNPGLKEGVVKLAPFSPEAPPIAQLTADRYTQRIINEKYPCGRPDNMWAMDSWKTCYNYKQ